MYDDVLELSPSNTEALAYKAWFLRLQGNVDAARPLVEDAVAIDPDYADARVFATAIALDVGDVDAAKGHLDAFDQLDAPRSSSSSSFSRVCAIVSQRSQE